MTSTIEPVLSVKNLEVSFKTDDGFVRAVRNVSFDVMPGETVGLVGESGSGKSVTNLAIMGLVPKPPGHVDGGQAIYKNQDLLTMPPQQLQRVRGKQIAMIFQDPMTSLNPLMTIEQQLCEMTRTHMSWTRKQARARATEMLEMVGISAPAKRLRDYPHQFSGGMRQRVMIAMALSCEPDVLIADEPTTALDVTIQAQILDLLVDLQKRRGTSIVMITHDLGVVAESCHRVMVMYAGRVVEKADVDSLFASPQHPYTKGLLRSLPRYDRDTSELLQAIPGQPPLLSEVPSGCAFRPRCPFTKARCEREAPALRDVHEDRLVACHVDTKDQLLLESQS